MKFDQNRFWYHKRWHRSVLLPVEEDDSDEHDDEVVYVAMKDESDEDEATTLVTYVNKNDR